MLIVKKFGGTSVANKERIFNVANRCIEEYRKGNDVVVVLSAMGKYTDELITMARDVNEKPPKREMDMLFTIGEQMSVALMAMAMDKLGVPAVSLNAFQVSMHTTSSHGNARLKRIDTERIRRELDSKKIVIVTGFQGVDKYDDYTTLGRGGSDTTAVALAAALHADACEIYTDVDGVYTADPRKVPKARKLKEITYDEMLDLATLGAGVLHNRSVEMAKKYGVPLVVRSSLNNSEGTVVKEEVTVERMLISGVALDTDAVRIAVIGLKDEPGVAFKLFDTLAKKNINVDVILQSIGRAGRKDISFTVDGNDLDDAVATLEESQERLGFKELHSERNIAKLSIVGSGMLSSGTNSASITMNLVDAKDRKRSTEEVCDDIEKLLADIPGADITVSSSDSAMGSLASADVTMNVYGYDAATLVDVEDELVDKLSQVDGLSDVEGSTGDTVPEAKVTIDRAKASQYGITTASVAGALSTAISGSTATQYKLDGTEIDVVIRYDTNSVNYLTDLNNLTVTSAYGTQVPLSDVATITMDESATTIMRENQKNYITISANADNMSTSEAQKLVEKAMADIELPDGCTYQFSGMMEKMNDTFRSLEIAMVVAVLLVYMIMASQFESLRYPFIVMFSMPLAITGAIIGLLITGNTITMPAMMGFVMLIGMVVNNGIVLVDYTNQLMDRGMNCYDALTSAGPRRLRPHPHDNADNRSGHGAYGAGNKRRLRNDAGACHCGYLRSDAVHSGYADFHPRSVYVDE